MKRTLSIVAIAAMVLCTGGASASLIGDTVNMNLSGTNLGDVVVTDPGWELNLLDLASIGAALPPGILFSVDIDPDTVTLELWNVSGTTVNIGTANFEITGMDWGTPGEIVGVTTLFNTWVPDGIIEFTADSVNFIRTGTADMQDGEVWTSVVLLHVAHGATTPPAIPEPATLGLLTVGLLGIVARRRASI